MTIDPNENKEGLWVIAAFLLLVLLLVVYSATLFK